MDYLNVNAFIALLILCATGFILIISYIVINHKLIKALYNENAELRAKLARYEQPEPEWVRQLERRLFDDAPSDPRINALN